MDDTQQRVVVDADVDVHANPPAVHLAAESIGTETELPQRGGKCGEVHSAGELVGIQKQPLQRGGQCGATSHARASDTPAQRAPMDDTQQRVVVDADVDVHVNPPEVHLAAEPIGLVLVLEMASR